jgi:cell division protein FtsB
MSQRDESPPSPSGTDTPTVAARTIRARRRSRTTQEVRERRRRLLRYGLWSGAIILLINALVGENGYLASVRARQEQEAAAARVAQLRAENQQLKDQARRLKADPIAQEEAARRQLGLIRPGETLVIVRDAQPAAQ